MASAPASVTYYPVINLTHKIIIAILLLHLSGCTWVYARWTYDFMTYPGNSKIRYEPGAEDLAALVDANLAVSMHIVEKQQYVPFKNARAIRIYVFNDREHYAHFSHASVLSRGSSTTDDVYLSEKLRERIGTLPNILTHELSHVHVHQYTGTYKYISDIPSWFLEGLAVTVSSGGGAEDISTEQAQVAMEKSPSFAPEETGSLIRPKSAHSYGLEPHMYYRQAGVFVEYLIRTNPRGFEAALKDLLKGNRFRDVWPEQYGKTVSGLWLTYEKSLNSSMHRRNHTL